MAQPLAMGLRLPLSAGLEYISEKLHPGGTWHDGFWQGIERADRSLDILYDRVSEHLDPVFAAMVAGIGSLVILSAL